MRSKHAGLLLAVLVLAACALPINPQPTLVPAPTAAPPAAPAPTSAADSAPTPLPPSAAPAAATRPAPSRRLPPADADELSRLAAARPLPRDQVTLAEALKGIGAVPAVARTTPLDVKVGDVETFWVNDLSTNTNYQIEAQLRYAGPVVLMYVDTTIKVDQAAIEQSAREFEQKIYPRDRELFGHESAPGIDGDPRLTIVNTALRGGAAGYFSGSDGVVSAVNRFSNQRDMFVMGVNAYRLGSSDYASTLAHEFQHMIEANVAAPQPALDQRGHVDSGAGSERLRRSRLSLAVSSKPRSSVDQLGAAELARTMARHSCSCAIFRSSMPARVGWPS